MSQIQDRIAAQADPPPDEMNRKRSQRAPCPCLNFRTHNPSGPHLQIQTDFVEADASVHSPDKTSDPARSARIMENVYRLDFTNKRLDHLNQKMELVLESLSGELYRSTDHLSTKIDEFNDALNQRMDLAFHDLGKAMEYTKLLHSLSHNLVVEMSKLKIEEEDMKVKARYWKKILSF